MEHIRKKTPFRLSPFSWGSAREYLLIIVGAFLQALALRLFLVPMELVTGGVSGLAQIINFYTGWPIGVMVFLGNIPLFILGWQYLGGVRFATRTAVAVIAFSLFTDLLFLFLRDLNLSKDLVLNTLYGGVVSGVGYGLVYRGRGTSGGSDILARILNHWRGIPISQSYLLTDSIIVLLAGLAFTWEKALYALVILYISGVAAEAAMGGADVTRTAFIVTDRPDDVSNQIMDRLGRGVTMLAGRGAYTGAEKIVLYCVVSRAEVNPLKDIVRGVDPQAFMVIGHAQEALGEGFQPLKE